MPPWLQQLMQSNKGVSGPYNEQVSPVATPANPSGVGTPPPAAAAGVNGKDFLDIFTNAITQHLAQQDALAPKRLQQGNDLLFGRHLGTDGQPVAEGSPFGGPIKFQSATERLADMTNKTGAYAQPSVQSRILPDSVGVNMFEPDTASAERGLEPEAAPAPRPAGPLAALYPKLGRESKQNYKNDPRYFAARQ